MIRMLQIQKPDGSTQVFAIEKPTIKIGRAEDNDLILLDTGRSVSRWHATITNDPNAAAVMTDLNSANGTTVNGQRVERSISLKGNDLITVGDFRLTLKEESTDVPFSIQAADVNLQDLQHAPQLLGLSAAKEFATASEMRSFELLYEVGMTLARSQTVEEITSAAVALLFRIGEVHRATVMLWDDATQQFEDGELYFRGGQKVGSGAGPYDPRKLVMSRTILNKVREENRPLLIRDTKSEAGLSSALSIVRAGIQAAFCSPLTCQGRFLGILYADNLAEPDAFAEADFRTFTAIAAQTGLALGNAIATKELLRREVQRQALKAYLPPQVADLILASDGDINLSGTLQEITVLFADIRGFTRMSERLDARDIVQMLNEFFTVMSDLIFQCGGTVDKFIGDCVMALFGAPLATPQSADQALRTAIEMQRAATQLNQSRTSGMRDLKIGIGLHTGPAVVGNIGSASRVQYTAIGDTVNVAARLVSRAVPEQIIASEAFRESLSDKRALQMIGEAELKGRQSKLNIYSVNWKGESLQSLEMAGSS